mmetsp:Transcript_20789/g.58085  ORF Transcript_20789/g.58085 Transcript_20789/m.58085 type:complete len:227 (-) Transcript_20789:1114-1794(-)
MGCRGGRGNAGTCCATADSRCPLRHVHVPSRPRNASVFGARGRKYGWGQKRCRNQLKVGAHGSLSGFLAIRTLGRRAKEGLLEQLARWNAQISTLEPRRWWGRVHDLARNARRPHLEVSLARNAEGAPSRCLQHHRNTNIARRTRNMCSSRRALGNRGAHCRRLATSCGLCGDALCLGVRAVRFRRQGRRRRQHVSTQGSPFQVRLHTPFGEPVGCRPRQLAGECQ